MSNYFQRRDGDALEQLDFGFEEEPPRNAPYLRIQHLTCYATGYLFAPVMGSLSFGTDISSKVIYTGKKVWLDPPDVR